MERVHVAGLVKKNEEERTCWPSSTFPNLSSSKIFNEKISVFLCLTKIFQHGKKQFMVAVRLVLLFFIICNDLKTCNEHTMSFWNVSNF